MAGKNTVQVDMLLNAKAMLNQLQLIDGKLNLMNYNLNTMHAKGAAGAKKHGSALGGLALKFVGYQLVLNQVMGAQQKLYSYVTEGITKFREFELRLAEVSTIMTDDFQAATLSMKAGIETLAISFGQNTSDLTKGLYDIMSAAFSAKDAINLLNTATKASIAGLSEVRTSVDIFTTVLNTYGMSVYEATAVSDTLFQSVVRGKFQFAELEGALGYVVPIAAQAGIAFEELMAALSTATRHGLHLDMASRGLAMALQNIINPSEGAAKAAEKYGIELSGLALRIKGISGVFGEMYQKTKEYGKIVLNELIPNIRSLRVAMVLAGEEGLEGMMDDLDRLSVSAGRTEQALNKIKDTSSFASKVITQDWEQTQRDVGLAWDKLALGAQQALTTIAKDWKSFLPVIGPIFTIIDYERDKAQQKWLQGKEEQYLGYEVVTTTRKAEDNAEELAALNERLRLKDGISLVEYTNKKMELLRKSSDHVVQYVNRNSQQYKSQNQLMQDYLDLQEEIAAVSGDLVQATRAGDTAQIEALSIDLRDLNYISMELGDTFNEVFGEPILGGMRELENLRLSLDELSFDIIRLRDELEKPMQFGWGGFQADYEEDLGEEVKGTLNYKMQTLLAEQKLADVRYDVKMGLTDSEYGYKMLSLAMQENIKIVREHEAALNSDRKATSLMNKELRLLQIQMLELQLVGMMRRRGLTRNEEKRMKALQIAQAKLRLKNIKETKNETTVQYTEYLDRKKILDDYVTNLENNTYQLKYTYDQQVTDLQTTINYEAGLLVDRKNQWQDITNDIAELGQDLNTRLATILSDENLVSAFDNIDISITDIRDNVKGLLQDIDALTEKTYPGTTQDVWSAPSGTGVTSMGDIDNVIKVFSNLSGTFGQTRLVQDILGNLTSRARGTEYVHETGLALIHKGETIGAAGKGSGNGGIIIENVTIEVAQIADIGDAEKLSAVLSVAQNSRLLGRSGKTRFRVR